MKKTLEAFKTKFDKNKLMTEALINEANELANKHETFNEKYIISGRKALYQLLQEIYIFSEKMKTISDGGLHLNQMKELLRDKYGIRIQQNSTTTSILVRYITKSDRKTSHMYAKAIDWAGKNSIPPEKFAFYLEQQGGIEAIRGNSVSNQQANIFQKKIALVKKYLQARATYPLASFKVNRKNVSNLPYHNQLSIVLCHENEGRHYVLAGAPLEDALDKKFVELLASNLPDDLLLIDKRINKFFSKAQKKRSQNKIKELVKKRPELASGVLRTNRIKQLALAKNS